MGIVEIVVSTLREQLASKGLAVVIGAAFASFVVLAIVLNVLSQLLFKNPSEPPVVFLWVPFIGSTITYGIDPYKFFFACREKYGDVFTFILLGKKTTVCLGPKGNDFILNGKLKDVNAEDIYTPLTTPVFGKDVVYDCPNSKLMEQKKFVKFGLTTEAFKSYVPLIVHEVEDFIATSKFFKANKGKVDITKVMAEVTIYTASRTLQGKEVRDKFNATFADYYHDLDMGFSPINFMLPWAPLPHNRKRDIAQQAMARTYLDIIEQRKTAKSDSHEHDMISNLMGSVYKDGTTIPDREVANMMIALLMAGQHSSSATAAWITLNLAARPDIQEELYQEQIRVFGKELRPLNYEDLDKLKLHQQVVKETLRLHGPIHSIMRRVTSPMPIDGTKYVVPVNNTLLAAPGVSGKTAEYFPKPDVWDIHRWDNEASAAKEENEDLVDYGYGLVSKGAGSPYLPFGAGRHRCIGEKFAYVQLSTITAQMVRNFTYKLPNGQTKIPDTDYSSLFSRPFSPADVVYEKRNSNEKSVAL